MVRNGCGRSRVAVDEFAWRVAVGIRVAVGVVRALGTAAAVRAGVMCSGDYSGCGGLF